VTQVNRLAQAAAKPVRTFTQYEQAKKYFEERINRKDCNGPAGDLNTWTNPSTCCQNRWNPAGQRSQGSYMMHLKYHWAAMCQRRNGAKWGFDTPDTVECYKKCHKTHTGSDDPYYIPRNLNFKHGSGCMYDCAAKHNYIRNPDGSVKSGRYDTAPATLWSRFG